jgi:hypothetical protein
VGWAKVKVVGARRTWTLEPRNCGASPRTQLVAMQKKKPKPKLSERTPAMIWTAPDRQKLQRVVNRLMTPSCRSHGMDELRDDNVAVRLAHGGL